MITPTQHEKNEWSRMAQDAYAKGHNSREGTAMTRHFPFNNPMRPVRIEKDDEGLWQIWTARDDKPGSRNNFVIAQGIQGELDAAFIRDAINAAIVKVNVEWHEAKTDH